MNSKEEKTNSEATNLENEGSIEKQEDANYSNEQTGEKKLDEKKGKRFNLQQRRN